MTFAEIYDKLNEDIDYEDILAPIFKRLNQTSEILDLGCGSGHSLKALKVSGFNNLSGLDNSSQMLDIAKLRIPDVTLYLHDINQPFFKTYDTIIAVFDVINYFDNPKIVLQHIYQMLKPNGVFIFDIYKEEYLEVMKDYKETELIPFKYTWKTNVYHIQLNHEITADNQTFLIKQYVYPLNEYINILKSIGFSVVQFNGNDERKYYIEATKLV